MTHDPEEALTLSDHVLIIQEGKIAQYDTPEEIIKNPGNGFVREFILKQLEIKKIISTLCLQCQKYSGRCSRKGTGDTDRAGRTGTGVIGERDENENRELKIILW